MLNQTFNFVYFQSIEEVLHKKLGMNLKQKNQTKRKHKHTLFAQDRSDANPNEWTKKKAKPVSPCLSRWLQNYFIPTIFLSISN